MIITNDENALRIKCYDVLDDEIGEIIDILDHELSNANRLGKSGIGLSAPQIGIAKNAAIIRIGKLKVNLINSKLENGYDSQIFREEGCLSFPGRVEDTIRFQEVYIKNNLTSPNSFIATGLLAVACQHEIDHFNSILFTDHIAPKQIPIINKNKMRPNEPCACGSNKKFKKCCGR